MRTGMTALCGACALRQRGDDGACVECGGALLDLRDAEARKRAEALLWVPLPGEPPLYGPRGRALRVALAGVASCVLATAAVWLYGGTIAGDTFAGIAATGALLAPGVAFLLERRPRRPGDVRRGVRLADVGATPRGNGVVSGRVVAVDTLRAFASDTQCVAVGLRAELPDGRLDDALATPFDVETADGERVRVSADDLLLVPSGAGERVRRVEKPLRLFLEERWLDARARDELHEQVVRDGDEVTVEGTIEERGTSGGYRGEKPRRALVGAVRVAVRG